ncbi:MAG TPA: metallophosphoesterase, partial [Pirellulales bacterium]
VALWAGFINRVHGTALPRRPVRALTALGVLGLVVSPLAVAIVGWQHEFRIIGRGDWDGVPWGLMFYVGLCAVGAPLMAGAWLVHRWQDRAAGTLLDERSRSYDLRAAALEGVESPAMQRLIQLRANEASQLAVTHKTLYLARLPAELDRLTIAHLSDLHFTGRVGKQFFVEVVNRVNELDADLVALTGDIVDKARYLPWLPDTVQRLRARHGVYFVLGNHDLYVPTATLRDMLTSAGLVDLGSQTATLELRGRRIALAGNELPWIGPPPDLSRLPADAALKIALSHAADQFNWGRRHGFDLLLAGHNHGGQVRLPLLGALACPSRHGTRYACGVFYARPTVMHVSRGVSGEVPLRWNCAPEISLLTLAAARPTDEAAAAARQQDAPELRYAPS